MFDVWKNADGFHPHGALVTILLGLSVYPPTGRTILESTLSSWSPAQSNQLSPGSTLATNLCPARLTLQKSTSLPKFSSSLGFLLTFYGAWCIKGPGQQLKKTPESLNYLDRFLVPIAFQQTNRPVPVVYSLNTEFQLCNNEKVFMMDPAAVDVSMAEMDYKGAFSMGMTGEKQS